MLLLFYFYRHIRFKHSGVLHVVLFEVVLYFWDKMNYFYNTTEIIIVRYDNK